MKVPPKNNPELGGDGRQSPGQSRGQRPTIVVLGSGFAGLWAARTLADGPVNVKLVDRHNYHTFFPLLYQARLLGKEHAKHHPLRVHQ